MKLGYGAPAATNAASAVISVPTVVTDENAQFARIWGYFPISEGVGGLPGAARADRLERVAGE